MRFRRSLAVLPLALVMSLPAALGQGIFVSPVPNIPFKAIISVERDRILPSGATQSMKSMHAIARDSQGRIYNSFRALEPANSNGLPPIVRMHIYDPNTRVATRLLPRHKIAIETMLQRPPRTQPPIIAATLAGNSAPLSQLVNEQDLGTRTMDGVPAHGVRKTQTISAADSGTGKEVKVVDEYWYSEDLRLDLLIKHSDPRTGSVTRTVTDVSRTDPDPVLFTVPSDYKIIHRGFVPTAQTAH